MSFFGTIASNTIIAKTPPTDFYAEFTMASTSDVMIIGGHSPQGSIEVSDDNVNWQDCPVVQPGFSEAYNGSLKYYFRQKVGQPSATHIAFAGLDASWNSVGSEFVTCDKLSCSTIADFSYMFRNAQKAKTFPAEIQATNGTDFSIMFENCFELENAPKMITPRGVDFHAMFSGCHKLINVPVFDTSKATDMSAMFEDCSVIKKLPKLVTDKVTNFAVMYQNCGELTDVPSMDTGEGTEFENMFNGCAKLTCLKKINTTKSTRAENMFLGTAALVAPNSVQQTAIAATPGIDWVNPNPCGTVVPTPGPFKAEFTMDSILDKIEIESDAESQGKIQYSFDGANWLEIGSTHIDRTGYLTWFVRQKPGAPISKKVKFAGSLFSSMSDIDTSQLTSFESMFSGCSKLTSVPALDTSNGTNFSMMFSNTSALTGISMIDTSKGVFFSGMFTGSGVTTIPAIDVSNGTVFDAMFQGANAVVSVPALNTVKGTSMTGMFMFASALTCIGGLNTVVSTDSSNLFLMASAVTAPNAADIALLEASPGIAWTNPNACP